MAYLVKIMPRAERDLESIFLYIRAETSAPANRWFRKLMAAVEDLSTIPRRHASTPEDRSLHHLLFGNKPHIYRVIFSIDEERKEVSILHVRHGAREAFQPDEIAKAP